MVIKLPDAMAGEYSDASLEAYPQASTTNRLHFILHGWFPHFEKQQYLPARAGIEVLASTLPAYLGRKSLLFRRNGLIFFARLPGHIVYCSHPMKAA